MFSIQTNADTYNRTCTSVVICLVKPHIPISTTVNQITEYHNSEMVFTSVGYVSKMFKYLNSRRHAAM